VPAKVAIVLFNLGGPDRPEAIKPFLVNLFTDPAILRVPFFVRPFLARAIARRRLEPAQANYAILGGRSPLLELTQQQGVALQAALPDLDARCFIAMRYWHPFSDEAARAVRDWQPDEVVLLPLYPQYSTTTTGLLAHENTHKHLLSPQSAEDWEFNFPSPPLSAVPTEGVRGAVPGKIGTRRLGTMDANGMPRTAPHAASIDNQTLQWRRHMPRP
jgi:ferrochelatase